MTIVLIKCECLRHPGCYTLTDKCERCCADELRDGIERILADLSAQLRAAAGGVDG